VTAEEAAAGTYKIDDVVLPLPGKGIIYPTHEIGPLYQQRLQEDGIAEVIAEGHRIREYALSGAYRHILARPGDMEWKLIRYNDPQCDLATTDLDRLNKAERPAHNDVESAGSLKALQLAFTLPSSTYATMFLREVMKTSTSASFHRNKEVASGAVKAEEAAAKEVAPEEEAAAQ